MTEPSEETIRRAVACEPAVPSLREAFDEGFSRGWCRGAADGPGIDGKVARKEYGDWLSDVQFRLLFSEVETELFSALRELVESASAFEGRQDQQDRVRLVLAEARVRRIASKLFPRPCP